MGIRAWSTLQHLAVWAILVAGFVSTRDRAYQGPSPTRARSIAQSLGPEGIFSLSDVLFPLFWAAVVPALLLGISLWLFRNWRPEGQTQAILLLLVAYHGAWYVVGSTPEQREAAPPLLAQPAVNDPPNTAVGTKGSASEQGPAVRVTADPFAGVSFECPLRTQRRFQEYNDNFGNHLQLFCEDKNNDLQGTILILRTPQQSSSTRIRDQRRLQIRDSLAIGHLLHQRPGVRAIVLRSFTQGLLLRGRDQSHMYEGGALARIAGKGSSDPWLLGVRHGDVRNPPDRWLGMVHEAPDPGVKFVWKTGEFNPGYKDEWTQLKLPTPPVNQQLVWLERRMDPEELPDAAPPCPPRSHCQVRRLARADDAHVELICSCDGLVYGPYRRWSLNKPKSVLVAGEFVQGLRSGLWTFRRGPVVDTIQYARGDDPPSTRGKVVRAETTTSQGTTVFGYRDGWLQKITSPTLLARFHEGLRHGTWIIGDRTGADNKTQIYVKGRRATAMSIAEITSSPPPPPPATPNSPAIFPAQKLRTQPPNFAAINANLATLAQRAAKEFPQVKSYELRIGPRWNLEQLFVRGEAAIAPSPWAHKGSTANWQAKLQQKLERGLAKMELSAKAEVKTDAASMVRWLTKTGSARPKDWPDDAPSLKDFEAVRTPKDFYAAFTKIMPYLREQMDKDVYINLRKVGDEEVRLAVNLQAPKGGGINGFVTLKFRKELLSVDLEITGRLDPQLVALAAEAVRQALYQLEDSDEKNLARLENEVRSGLQLLLQLSQGEEAKKR